MARPRQTEPVAVGAAGPDGSARPHSGDMTTATGPTNEDAGTVRSVHRALEILSLFDEQHQTRTIGEIVRGTRLAKTTVLRLLVTLESAQMLAATPKGYTAGPGLWRWAYLVQRSWEIPAAAREVMRSLVERERETVNVYVMRGLNRVCVAQEESPLALRHVVRIGDQLPLWAGASAKVLLRDATAETLERVVAAAPAGTVDADRLRAQIHSGAEAGYQVSHGERETGLSAVAVPVTTPDGALVVASLSFSGPTARFPQERIPELVDLLRSAAQALTVQGFDHPIRNPM